MRARDDLPPRRRWGQGVDGVSLGVVRRLAAHLFKIMTARLSFAVVFILLAGAWRGSPGPRTDATPEHAKALAAAAEPVNRKYQSALQSLLRRATQANDLPTANRVNDELKKLGVAVQAGPDSPALTVESMTARLGIGTRWVWFEGETLTFLAAGKAQWKQSPTPWPWKVTSAARRMVEGEHAVTGKKFTMTFDADLKTGTIEGAGKTRPTRLVAP